MQIKQMYFKELNNFSKWAKDEMARQDMTGMELAKRTGLPQSSIYYYISGKVEPSYFAVTCICGALGFKIGVVSDDN